LRIAGDLNAAGLEISHRIGSKPFDKRAIGLLSLRAAARNSSTFPADIDSGSRWLYMSVNIGPGSGAAGNGTVLCQVEGPDGRITTIGSFQLTDGYGYWGSPDPAANGPLTGARIVTTTGAILATATFPT
jgi:hypothetical protein